jgi:hypothetical protein
MRNHFIKPFILLEFSQVDPDSSLDEVCPIGIAIFLEALIDLGQQRPR